MDDQKLTLTSSNVNDAIQNEPVFQVKRTKNWRDIER